MGLKLLADIHISPITVSEIQVFGYKIHRVSDLISATASDSKIIELAILEKAAIITQDLDFPALVAQSGLIKPSIVSLRVRDAKPHSISTILKTVLAQIAPDLKEGAIVIWFFIAFNILVIRVHPCPQNENSYTFKSYFLSVYVRVRLRLIL